MSTAHEVISSFLDDEPFELQELATALEDAEARRLLVDLVALRQIVQPDEAIPLGLASRPSGWSRLRPVMAVAAVLVALVGGYLMGQSRNGVDAAQAPAPTRVVQAPAAWATVESPTVRGAQ